MDRDRELALLVRIGTPEKLNYEGLRRRPFWRLRELLCCHLYERRIYSDVLRVRADQAIGVQGFPPKEMNTDAFQSVVDAAEERVSFYLQSVLPWVDEDSLNSKRIAKRRLLGESADLIEAWIARFEPENLAAYREEVEKALERAKQDA